MLSRADGRTPLGDLLSGEPKREAVVKELVELWSRRMVRLTSG
ncbi:hypothetical protein [Sorangium sp. So ce233]